MLCCCVHFLGREISLRRYSSCEGPSGDLYNCRGFLSVEHFLSRPPASFLIDTLHPKCFTLGAQLYVQQKQRDYSNQSDAVIMRCFIAVYFCCFVMFSKNTTVMSFCIAVTQMYYALFVINKLLTCVCDINNCFSSVKEIIYCIVIYFFLILHYFFKSLNGRDSGKYLKLSH